MQAINIYQLNSGVIPLIGLMDNSLTPPQYVNNATSIIATLNDPDGDPVEGLDGVTGAYVAGSNGNYNFPVSGTFNPPTGGGYTLVIDVTAVSGSVGHWVIPANVVTRGTAAGSS